MHTVGPKYLVGGEGPLEVGGFYMEPLPSPVWFADWPVLE